MICRIIHVTYFPISYGCKETLTIARQPTRNINSFPIIIKLHVTLSTNSKNRPQTNLECKPLLFT